VRFSNSELVTPCLSVGLSVFPENLKNRNGFPSNIYFADAIVRFYSGVKMILFHLMTLSKEAVVIGFET